LMRIGIAIRTVNTRSTLCQSLPAMSVITWGNEEPDGIGRDNPRSAGDALSVAKRAGGKTARGPGALSARGGKTA
jgi:hypothetical protein